MISALYDPVVFLSNQEYREKYPEKPPVDVSSAVKRQYLYFLGQSKSFSTPPQDWKTSNQSIMAYKFMTNCVFSVDIGQHVSLG